MKTKGSAKIVISGISIILLLCTSANADIFYLKNGRRIEGTIVEESEDSITINIGIGEVVHKKAEINRIEKGSTTQVRTGNLENAAEIYNEIFATMHVFPSEALGKEADSIIDNGWRKEHSELNAVLKNNKKILEKVEKVSQIPYCNFYEGIIDKSFLNTKPIPYKKTRTLTRIILLEGRKEEKAGNMSRALNRYITILKFSHDISQDKSIIALSLGAAIKNMAYKPLMDYISNKKISNSERRSLLNYLNYYASEKVTLVNSLREEKQLLLNTAKQTFLNEKEIEKKYKDPKMRKFVMAFGHDVVDDINKLLNYYYGKYEIAARLNSTEKINEVNREINALAKETKEQAKSFKGMATLFYKYASKPKKEKSEFLAANIARLFFVIAFPNYKRSIELYYRTEENYKILTANIIKR